MMSFVAGGMGVQLSITNDGWWPDIDVLAMRETLRIDGSVTDARLRNAALGAMLSVNRELTSLKNSCIEQGAENISDVDAPEIGGESSLTYLYRRAVYCTAGAELVERYRSYDTTNSGHKEADLLCPSIDEYRRDARWAIRDLLGAVHTTVELI
jgi:hypothetical protein